MDNVDDALEWRNLLVVPQSQIFGRNHAVVKDARGLCHNKPSAIIAST